MKFICVFSICILYFATIQTSDADVICLDYYIKGPLDKLNQTYISVITAAAANISYNVPGVEFKGNFEKECSDACAGYMCLESQNTMIQGVGCPADFYAACSTFWQAIFEVQSKGPNELDYRSDDFRVTYSSGCGTLTNGTECIAKKFMNQLMKVVEDVKQLHSGQSGSNIRHGDGSLQADDSKGLNDSSKQNMKFIGFIISGWILNAAW